MLLAHLWPAPLPVAVHTGPGPAAPLGEAQRPRWYTGGGTARSGVQGPLTRPHLGFDTVLLHFFGADSAMHAAAAEWPHRARRAPGQWMR